MCSVVRRSGLYSTGARALLTHESDRVGVFIKRSTVAHEKARNGLVACWSFWEKEVVGSYYGSLSYADLRKESQLAKWYREEYIEFTAESFRR